MSTLKTGALRGTSGTADSIQLHASNQSVTFPGDVTISGAVTGAGNVKYTTANKQDLSGNASVEFTVPSNCFRCWFTIKSMSTASSSAKYVQLKVGGAYDTSSGYSWGASELEDGQNCSSTQNGNDGQWIFLKGLETASHNITGIFDMSEYDDADGDWIYTYTGNVDASATGIVSSGYKELGGELQAVKFASNSGNFDSGSIKPHFLELV